MEVIPHSKLSSAWLKATVIGSLWASVEIVAGSFLHNLQLPLTGTILTAFAIFLLSAFSRIWKDAGIFWRAGIICALMKSISPSAVIIGPMIGIITEAFLFEMMLMLLGRNLLGTLAGGALAAVSAIFHKFFTLLILYGFDFVRILDSLYQYAVKQLNISSVRPLEVIGLLVAFYLLIGLLSATFGLLAGKKFTSSIQTSLPFKRTGVSNEKTNFELSGEPHHALILIMLHLLVLILILWLFNLDFFITASFASALYTGYCVYKYPATMNRLKKISVWFQFILIVVASVFIWDVLKSGDPNGESGFLTGVKMIVRAIVLIIGFAAISVELKNPLVKTVLYKRGMSDLYQSLSLAFGVLPDLVDALSRSKRSILNPVSLTSQLLSTSQNLIELFQKEQENLPAIFVISGGVGEGKTTCAKNIIQSLQTRGLRCKGFLSVGTEANNVRTGFNLLDINTSESIILCKTTYQQGWRQTGRYFFNPDAIEFGNKILDPQHLLEADLLVIDEIGPMELNNQGWSEAIGLLCHSLSTPQLWMVRENLVKQVVRKWSVGDIRIFHLKQDSVERIEQSIIADGSLGVHYSTSP
jgi:nucleoside-triphosphatase THEP1